MKSKENVVKDESKQMAELLDNAKNDTQVYDLLSVAMKAFIDGIKTGLTIKDKSSATA